MPAPNWRDRVRQKVVITPIQNDDRTLKNGGLLGWSSTDAYNVAIRFGQAEFDEPIGDLEPIDRARLYALLNQPGHLAELDEAFHQLLADQPIGNPVVFDIGCGPFTAGLSLATQLGPTQDFRYYGIDIYDSMQELAGDMVDAASNEKGLHYATQCTFHKALSAVQLPDVALNNVKIFIASYLLASDSLDVASMVSDIQRIADGYSRGPSLLLYTNSLDERAGEKFNEFEALMLAAGFECRASGPGWLPYRKTVRKLHYALFYKFAG